jgi:hypothetical protein
MNLLSKGLLICAAVLSVGCSKEKPVENPPAPPTPPESAIFKKQIETLHKAEDLNQAAKDAAIEQRKQIDAATQ